MNLSVLSVSAAISVAAAVAVPVAASQWIVAASGTAFQAPTNPPGVPRIDVPALDGMPVTFGLLIDSAVPVLVNPGPGGFGQSGTYLGAVGIFFLEVGPYRFERPAALSTPFTVIDDFRNPSGLRQDQVGVSFGTGFLGGAANPPLVVDPELGQSLFVSSFFFGRIATGTDSALPTLVTSVDFPDLASIFELGFTSLSFQLRSGSPATPAELAALPAAFLSVPLSGLFVARLGDPGIIPEPGSWAMLIAGFGLVGMALRRRRVAPATS